MNYSNTQKFTNPLAGIKKIKISPVLLFGLIISTALIFFEMFNYSTTDYALKDMLGGLKFAGIRWSTTLSVAFCAIDFAGIARLFTPESNSEEPKEVWYLFGAWILAATMNALLTWWGVSLAVGSHIVQSTSVMDPALILKVVPIFVALMVWVIRILIIGTISAAGDKFFRKNASSSISRRPPTTTKSTRTAVKSNSGYTNNRKSPVSASSRSRFSTDNTKKSVLEPTYHNLSMSAGSASQKTQKRSQF